MDGCITQIRRNLGEIHPLFPDQLFGCFNLQVAEIINDPAAVPLAEKVLKLCPSHLVVFAYLFDRDFKEYVGRQILAYPFVGIRMAFKTGRRNGGRT